MYCLILNYFTELSLNLLVQHGDIEIKSGPKGKYSQYHTFGHWNWNSLPAHNYAKVPLLHTFNTLINLIWFVSQKHILILQFQLRRSYKLIRAAHHGNIKRSWVYIYHKFKFSKYHNSSIGRNTSLQVLTQNASKIKKTKTCRYSYILIIKVQASMI